MTLSARYSEIQEASLSAGGYQGGRIRGCEEGVALSVVYRAIWSDRQSDVAEFALERLRGWVKEKTAGAIAVPDEGAVVGPVHVPARPPDIPEQAYDADLRIDRATGTGKVVKALSATFSELRPDGSRWDTTLRCWNEATTGDEPFSRLWVDVECVDTAETDHVTMAAPRLAVDMINKGVRPSRGQTRLHAAPVDVRGAEDGRRLTEAITAEDRDVPFVVFSHDETGLGHLPSSHTFEQITRSAATQLAGVAVVHVADPEACDALTRVLGSSHGLWGGALRVYLPGVDPGASGDFLRHRYVLPDRFVGFPNLAGTIISRTLTSFAAARRPPATYPEARSMLRQAKSSDWENLARLLQEQNDVLAARNASLADDLNQGEERYMSLVIDLEDALKERDELSAQLEKARRQIRHQAELLARNGVRDESWSQAADGAARASREIPETADNLSDAAAKTQLYLTDRLVLPDAALRDLDELDSAIESQAWGQSAWRGFRALHAYAADQANGVGQGSFWDWCARSMSPLAWPAVAKKLSMSESETVEANPTLRAARTLPVSTEVCPDGSIYMPAHLKISAGGGDLAPRIYFHWDPVGLKVHIGYFGPHKHIPNSRS